MNKNTSKCETRTHKIKKCFTFFWVIWKGKGIIVILAELTEKFKNLLIPYYEGKDEDNIKKIIKEKCYITI